MATPLVWKPDFDKTAARFEAWWHAEIVDRPPVTVSVRPQRPPAPTPMAHSSVGDRWLDVEYVVSSAIARMERTDYVGDSFPIFWPNIGPEISAAPFGCELTFTEDTSWSHPVVDRCEAWQQILTMQPDFGNVYWRTMEQMMDLAIERSDGRYVVGITDLHGNYDILAALRDPQQLCLDLIDCPELVQAAGRHVAQAYVAMFQRQYERVRAAGFGSTTWLPMYHDGPAYVPSCDFWIMVSGQMAAEMMLPDILTEMAPLQRSIFHLDGPKALRHLDLLLDLPQLNAVQWVYGAGAGPAARWIDVYRRIQAAGKSLQLIAEDPADALTVLEALDAHGVWVSVSEPFDTVAEAEAFVAAM
ncbi:MAG: hypothetical protein R2873_34425 [Caldilineaceae bacterium]|nr:hypothetical protein [Caldilineaceae bacterium]